MLVALATLAYLGISMPKIKTRPPPGVSPRRYFFFNCHFKDYFYAKINKNVERIRGPRVVETT